MSETSTTLRAATAASTSYCAASMPRRNLPKISSSQAASKPTRLTTCATPAPFSAETRVCEARPRARSDPVPQPPPALASAAGNAAPITMASCARACCIRSKAISSVGLAATARSTNEFELAVVQRPPPLCCFQGVIGVAIAERTDRRRRRELRGQRRLGRMIIRTDRTGGQRRANERAENSGATSRNIAAGAATAATPKLCRPQHRRVHSNSPKAARLHATASAIIHRRRRMHSPPADDVPLADEDGRFRMGVQATVSRSSPEKRMERLYGHSGKYCVDRSLEDREQPSVRR